MKKVSEDDLLLWKKLTEEVKPLPKETVPPPYNPRLDKHTIRHFVRQQHHARTENAPLPCVGRETRTGFSSSRRIVRPKNVSLEARLDLHGLTKENARKQMQQFFIGAQHQGYRWVLVITGKGPPMSTSSDGAPQRGILRQEVPEWLETFPQVGAYCESKPEHGGAGALYVRLKVMR